MDNARVVMLRTQTVTFQVVPGRGAASGAREYRDIKGSIHAQKPHFRERGINLDAFHEGTLNLEVSASGFVMAAPLIEVRNLVWLPGRPGENFDFCECSLSIGSAVHLGLIYFPRPETKWPDVAAPRANVVEVLAPLIEGISYGSRGLLHVDSAQIRFTGLDSD